MGQIRKMLRRAAYVLNPLTARAVDKQKKNCVLARSLRARFARVCNASRVASALKNESAAHVITAAELALISVHHWRSLECHLRYAPACTAAPPLRI